MAVLRIKEIMNLKSMSRDELAKRVDVTTATISNITSEKNFPTITLLLKIAQELDVDVRELFISTKGTSVSQMEIDEAKDLIEKSLKILEGKS
jgi:transcriptional regulator with XRE-family HTH domain